MDPPPLELIVVDNDPGDEDCRAEVEQAGAGTSARTSAGSTTRETPG